MKVETMDIAGFKVTIQFIGWKYRGVSTYGISVFKNGWMARTHSLNRHIKRTVYALIETYPNAG